MVWLIVIILLVGCWLSVKFRILVRHPFKAVRYAVTDFYKYIRYHKNRVCKTGNIIAYVGLFGKGKTLSAVAKVKELYEQYNDKRVYDTGRRKWVTQVVHIVSNVHLTELPYEEFVSLSQMVSCAERYKEIDKKNDTYTVHIFLGDEFSVQLNSRKFKENIDPLFLNTLLTCRHHHIMLIYTAQRFGHVDALLRQVTSYAVECLKLWRLMVHWHFDAYELENCSNPLLIKPFRRDGFFVDDALYNAYDTLACVGNLSKSCLEKDMLSEEEILALQQNTPDSMETVSSPSRKYWKKFKKVR